MRISWRDIKNSLYPGSHFFEVFKNDGNNCFKIFTLITKYCFLLDVTFSPASQSASLSETL